MSKTKQMVSGVMVAWSNRWLVSTIALCIVVGVNEWGADFTLADTIEAYNEPTQNELVIEELQRYVAKKEAELWAEKERFYREQVRLQALEATREDLVTLVGVSPHVDYEYMLDRIDRLR